MLLVPPHRRDARGLEDRRRVPHGAADQRERRRPLVVDVGELFNRLGPIVKALDPKQVNTFLDAITQALDGNTDKVRESIDNLAVVAQSLGSRDQAIGRLVENVNTVAGALDDRDAQIRTVLDNLVLISQTFSQNTDAGE